jgi:hypothetical protein
MGTTDGAQDIYLTGNPQITFFKVVYRRHTNFSMESIQQTFNGSADFGRRVTCTISRNGDLVHRMYLQVSLPALTSVPSGEGWCQYIGQHLIKTVEVEIGGQRVDKHYGSWMNVWNELSQTQGRKIGYNTMVGSNLRAGTSGTIPATNLYIPLEFWFCRNPGLALPLIALQYHEVKINIEFAPLSECTSFGKTGISLTDASLYVDYVYLDTDERRRFAQVSHEYLIEQLQFTGDETAVGGANKFKLNFNHPTKFLAWVIRTSVAENDQEWFNWTTDDLDPVSGLPVGSNPVITAKLQLNGHDRFSERDGNYFNLVQPYQHFDNVPATGINVYSFGLKPLEHQPSGSCNFSRIDNATLQMTLPTAYTTYGAKCKIFAVNYNVLRIMSGMGGLAYSS